MATSRAAQDAKNTEAEASSSTDQPTGGEPEGGAPAVDPVKELRQAIREESKAGFLEAVAEAKPVGQSRQGNTEKVSFLPTWLEELFLGKPSD